MRSISFLLLCAAVLLLPGTICAQKSANNERFIKMQQENWSKDWQDSRRYSASNRMLLITDSLSGYFGRSAQEAAEKRYGEMLESIGNNPDTLFAYALDTKRLSKEQHLQHLKERALSGFENGDGTDLTSPRNPKEAAHRRIKGRVVFMGNSITDNWYKFRPEFFKQNRFVGRGISGQTTAQMVLRFKEDVIGTGASKVVILAGTNDIAGNTGLCTFSQILSNIEIMCTMAKEYGIKVVLCSLLPAHNYIWAPDAHPERRIPEFNKCLEQFAADKRIEYINLFEILSEKENPDNINGIPDKYSKDGVHPNVEGYLLLEEALMKHLR